MKVSVPLFAVALALCAGNARAQDSHYWNLQYGPTAELLGGVVVGSAQDLSATYYDPASLALAKDPAFLLSLNTVQLEQVSLESASDKRNLSSSRFASAPALIAGKLPDGWLVVHSHGLVLSHPSGFRGPAQPAAGAKPSRTATGSNRQRGPRRRGPQRKLGRPDLVAKPRGGARRSGSRSTASIEANAIGRSSAGRRPPRPVTASPC